MSYHIPRVVVTGASGFLGKAVVQALARCDVNVVAVARQSLPGGVKVYDYADTPAGEVLVHLAEERDRASVNSAGAAYEHAAATTLQALLDKGWKKVIYASSAVLYGDSCETPRSPSDSVYVSDAYTRVKRTGEEAVMATGVGIVARLANLYGQGMASNNVVSTILSQIPGEGPVTVLDTSPIRDFLWVEDAASALADMATMTLSGGNRIYNIGSGCGTSIGDLVQMVLDIAGCPERPIAVTQPSSRSSCIILDITETMTAWHWHPRIDLRQGLTVLLANRVRGENRHNG